MSKKIAHSKNKQKSPATRATFAIENIRLKTKEISDNYKPKDGDGISLKLSVNATINRQKSLLIISVSAIFQLDEQHNILSFAVENEFHIPNVQNLVVNKKFTEVNFLEYLADLSLSHTRGLQASIINGTPLYKLFIPVVNLSQIQNEVIESIDDN